MSGFVKSDKPKTIDELEILEFPNYLSLGRNTDCSGRDWDVHMIICGVIYARPYSPDCPSRSTATIQPSYSIEYAPYRWKRVADAMIEARKGQP